MPHDLFMVIARVDLAGGAGEQVVGIGLGQLFIQWIGPVDTVLYR